MRTINIFADGVTLRADHEQDIIAGSVNDLECGFDFSPDWAGLSKVAVFRAGTVSKSIVLIDDTPVALPWETLVTSGMPYRVGVYGYRGETLVRQTTPITIGYVQLGTDRAAAESADPTPTLAQQILTQMGDLSELGTTDKSSLVAAINEAAQSGGGGSGGGGDKTHVHTQSTPSATWNVTHGLNKYPAVSVIDSAGSEIICGVEYADRNQCTLRFSGEFSGKAFFN